MLLTPPPMSYFCPNPSLPQTYVEPVINHAPTPRGKRLCNTYTTRAAPATPGYRERRSRSPHTFPGSQRQREALHWGRRPRPGRELRSRRALLRQCGLTPHFARSALDGLRKILRSPTPRHPYSFSK
jgi:hypothetical protein